MIDELGFEVFTFKKLAEGISSTEASVYRYFENKHRLLIYVIDWYWTWLDHRLDFELNNIEDPKERLRKCLKLLTQETKNDQNIAFMDMESLHRIVMTEFEKHTSPKMSTATIKRASFCHTRHSVTKWRPSSQK